MKKWMLFIVAAVPWARKLWNILRMADINPEMFLDPMAAFETLVTECICLVMIIVMLLAAIHQREEEKELLESRREIRRLRAKK